MAFAHAWLIHTEGGRENKTATTTAVGNNTKRPLAALREKEEGTTLHLPHSLFLILEKLKEAGGAVSVPLSLSLFSESTRFLFACIRNDLRFLWPFQKENGLGEQWGNFVIAAFYGSSEKGLTAFTKWRFLFFSKMKMKSFVEHFIFQRSVMLMPG